MEIKKEEKKQRGKKRKNCLIFNLFSQLQMEKNQKDPVRVFLFHLKSSWSYVFFHPMKVPSLSTYFCLDAIVALRTYISLSFCLNNRNVLNLNLLR